MSFFIVDLGEIAMGSRDDRKISTGHKVISIYRRECIFQSYLKRQPKENFPGTSKSEPILMVGKLLLT